MGRIEWLKKLSDICRNERTASVGDFFTMDDIDYLLSRLQIAEEKLKFLAHNSNRFSYTLSEIEKFAKEALEQIQKEE